MGKEFQLERLIDKKYWLNFLFRDNDMLKIRDFFVSLSSNNATLYWDAFPISLVTLWKMLLRNLDFIDSFGEKINE